MAPPKGVPFDQDKIAERRTLVGRLLVQELTEEEMVPELAKHGYHVSQQTVSNDVQLIHQEGRHYYEQMQKRSRRAGTYFKELVDKIKEAQREAWRVYHSAEHDHPSVRIKILHGIRDMIETQQKVMQLVAPSMDKLEIQKMIHHVEKLLYETEQKAKIHPLTETPVAVSSQ